MRCPARPPAAGRQVLAEPANAWQRPRWILIAAQPSNLETHVRKASQPPCKAEPTGRLTRVVVVQGGGEGGLARLGLHLGCSAGSRPCGARILFWHECAYQRRLRHATR